jgi:hypothetical protein
MNGLTTVNYDNLHSYNVVDSNKECRYTLVREWDSNKQKATIIMYNPAHLDPNPYILGQSLSRCAKPIMENGDFGAIEVVNLFSKTSKSQKGLAKEYQIFEELNFNYIKAAVEGSSMVVLAWGRKDAVVSKSKQFIDLISNFPGELKCFGILNNKQPKYPRNLTSDANLKDCFMDNRGSIHFN